MSFSIQTNVALLIAIFVALLFAGQGCTDQTFEKNQAANSGQNGDDDGLYPDDDGNGGKIGDTNNDGVVDSRDNVNSQPPPNLPVTNDPDLPSNTPISAVKDNICGGGRTDGKWHDISADSKDACTMPRTNDRTCDRWGCAVARNNDGDLHCPQGTRRLVTGTNPVEYFVCVKNVGTNVATPDVCGGTRKVGKYEDPQECTDFRTNDQSCNRWGCAVMVNSQGDSACRPGTFTARISDNWTNFLCFGN